ncbi:hypothetical protein ACTXT7_002752 [Hymenolepis weldensis]
MNGFNLNLPFPYMDYTVYAIVGATGLFAIIVYIICAVSSGWNAKRCFEGTRATSCGRCMNATVGEIINFKKSYVIHRLVN